jgi:hypothetical protein
LGLHDNILGKRIFHFEAFWIKLEGFHDVVQTASDFVTREMCPFQSFFLKLKKTAKSLISSNNQVGHIRFQLAMAKEILHRLEIGQDDRILSMNELWLKNKLKKHTLLLSSLRRTMARLQSRISWLKDGDANSKLFHLHARHRKRKNIVTSLREGDVTLTGHDEKAAAVDHFFFNLIGTNVGRDRINDLDALAIPSHELSELDAPFSEKEVWDTIVSLPPDKAPGPDGFTGRFYRVCWHIIKHDFMKVVSAVWGRKFNNFGKLNSAYITLIPKKEGAAQVKDFRPISLVHSVAKLITKILANRLAARLHEMVCANQSAFIKG